MRVVVLGAAAGGGFPQWNCWCPTCRAARADSGRALSRTQSGVAVSADGARWFLLNASPDVREQVARLPGVAVAPDAVRHVPIEGVVFTDAELDHTLGLALLREGRKLAVWATPQVARILEEDSRLLPTTRAFADVALHDLTPDGPPVALHYRDGAPSGLTVEAFAVAGDPPRFARSVAPDEPGHTVGLVVRRSGGSGGGTLAYVPGCGALDDSVTARLADADVVLLDGTFWRDDELIALGVSASRAADMGHVPISGPGGSLFRIASLPSRPSRRVAYVHINNTNPILLEDSVERGEVEAAGIAVGQDGMVFEI